MKDLRALHVENLDIFDANDIAGETNGLLVDARKYAEYYHNCRKNGKWDLAVIYYSRIWGIYCRTRGEEAAAFATNKLVFNIGEVKYCPLLLDPDVEL